MSDSFDTALSAIRNWYYTEIRELADVGLKDLREARKLDPDTDTEEYLTEWIDEATDSHSFVIYTVQSKAALLASDNESAYEDEMGEPPSGPMALGAQTCMAMRADLREYLAARSDDEGSDAGS